MTEQLRIVVRRWDEHLIYGQADASEELTIDYSAFPDLQQQLYVEAILQLLDVETAPDGVLRPMLIVLDPDYLIDVTTICQCVRPSGNTPMHYLLSKFLPRTESLAIQLGNVANQFLDDAVNRQSDYHTSMQHSFRDYALRYCTLQGIDHRFFTQCQSQHAHIQHTVLRQFPQYGIQGGQLEPSFVCNLLGIQGRFDLLAPPHIVELKSGKCDEYHNTYKSEHAWQMDLYREILHYSLGVPRQQVATLLFYSHYPRLYPIPFNAAVIREAVALRNGIVHIDRQLRTRPMEFLMSLTEDDFNPLRLRNKLYDNYQRPRILQFLHTLHEASPLALHYFATMTAFVAREQRLAKVGTGNPDTDRGFAQAWLFDTETKRLQGNIITDLRLTPILDNRGLVTHLEAQGEADGTNFREGDGVVLYERLSDADRLTNHQSVRCIIERILPHTLRLRLAFPQHDIFHAPSYAIEPSHSDSLFAVQYRGLFALLLCDPRRRDLLLSQRRPSPQSDYYLLVGPPGSGKTSITLRHMVEDFLVRHPQENLLLMAYTNRAVDEICATLSQVDCTYVRLGQEVSCAPPYRHRLLHNAIAHCTNRQAILDELAPIRIVCGTVASLSSAPELLQLKPPHTAILDEASQVLEPQLLPLLCQTDCRLVMIGDHKQLPAVVQQEAAESQVSDPLLQAMGLTDCRQSLFERLHRHAIRHGYDDLHGQLTRQGRMHQDICRFVSHRYYADHLDVVPLPHQTGPLQWQNQEGVDPTSETNAPASEAADLRLIDEALRHRMSAIDVEGEDGPNPKVNQAEARIVALLVQRLHQLHQACTLPWQPTTSLGIIVPFRGQIAAIRQQMQSLGIPDAEDITIDTVERYQGSQRDVIIFSTVVRTPGLLSILSAPVESEGQLIDRKLNVAITRARHQFILVGRLQLLARSADYRSLIQYIRQPGID